MKLRHDFTVLLLLLPRAHTASKTSAEVSVLCLEPDEKVTFPNTLRTRRSTSRYLVSPRHAPCIRFLVRTNCQEKLCGWNLLPSKNFTITYFLDFLPRVALLASTLCPRHHFRVGLLPHRTTADDIKTPLRHANKTFQLDKKSLFHKKKQSSLPIKIFNSHSRAEQPTTDLLESNR